MGGAGDDGAVDPRYVSPSLFLFECDLVTASLTPSFLVQSVGQRPLLAGVHAGRTGGSQDTQQRTSGRCHAAVKRITMETKTYKKNKHRTTN